MKKTNKCKKTYFLDTYIIGKTFIFCQKKTFYYDESTHIILPTTVV